MANIVASDEDQISNRILITDAVSSLPEKYRAVLALSAAGFTQRESGAILGRTRTAIGSTLRQAKKALLERLMEAAKTSEFPTPMPGM